MPRLNSFNPHSYPKGQKQLLLSFEDEVTATQNGPVASLRLHSQQVLFTKAFQPQHHAHP